MVKKIKAKFSKISFKDRNLLKSYGGFVAIFSSCVTLISFCCPPTQGWSWSIGSFAAFFSVLVFKFIYDWYQANKTSQARLKINGTNVNVYIGDLFEQDGIKVIGVNNYIDLIADDIKVSKTTLHGQFVMRHSEEIGDIKEAIENSNTLIVDTNTQQFGKQSYEYGSCVIYKDYVLTVLTKFDMQNKAYTSIREYMLFWMTFWDNIDGLYNSRSINIPILGSGQTRFRGVIPEKQELLEIALWTLEKSGFHNKYADKSINFIIHGKDAPEIDFYSIQKGFE